MGIVEVVLTVLAWRKGWYGFALIPIAVALVVAIILVQMGVPQSTLYMVDIVLIGVLGIMVAQGRQTVPVSTQS